jgi:thiosulfate/3-mercaptopyruvate sulfurtransferase
MARVYLKELALSLPKGALRGALWLGLIALLAACAAPATPTPTSEAELGKIAPNHHKLVSPGWVADLIAGGNPGTADSPSTYPGKGYVIAHASTLYWKGEPGYDPNEDYDSGHIPGAIHIPINTLDTTVPGGIYPWTNPDDGNLLPPAQLQMVIENYGIAHDKTVVVYCGEKSYSSGCYRLAWALMYAGVEDVRVLNGGYKAWVANGGAIETTPNTPTPVAFGITVPGHPEYLATTADVEVMRTDPASVVVDIRSWKEFGGADLGVHYEFFTAEGHIPGAVWGRNMDWYTNDDGTLRSYTEVEQEWRDLGITPDKKVTFY